ncbi:hypothetical protein [Flagellimonas eckloniae]|uniref:Uncharacterized protein n=1 Tax=Flagellimonas eckloniae TaxID=346185 RepID=A0A0Q1H934_9FLAO|nr:hypothetical protein [Allomuricauda eckloniae]KQC30174.1 hypothetical protein AAY42_10010 [Allomuricauda eckloniae]
MPDSKEQLKSNIEAAFDDEADQQVTVADARERIAQKIADAVEGYVVGRSVQVNGVQTGSGSVTGTIQ